MIRILYFRPRCRDASRAVKKLAILRNPYPRLGFGEGYLEMATGGPRLQEMLVEL